VAVTVKRVFIESDDRYDHLVRPGLFFDGTARSVCGKNPFPERWAMPIVSKGPICPACVNTAREKGLK
jgi:hypothetical protein